MKSYGPLFEYLAILAVIQPGRIQDIERYAAQVIPGDHVERSVSDGDYRKAHEAARNKEYVMQVRRGSYFLTPAGRAIVRKSDLHKEIDNLRFFLMKAQRKRYR